MLKNARAKAAKKDTKGAKAKKPRIKAAATERAAAPETAPAGEQATPKARKKADRKDGKMSGLDAAVKVLKDAGTPLNAKDMVERMLSTGLWQTSGKTPQATIYAAIIREIAKLGDNARFKKTERGMFCAAK